jgi:effector-binding domain-containing protein
MYEIEERTLTDQPTMVVSGKVKLEDIPAFLGRVYTTVERQVHESGAHVIGAPFARYRALDPEYREFEIEAGVPVLIAAPGHGEVHASSLPGGPAAVTVHIGPYERMEPAYRAIEDWLKERGAEPTGPAWEVYHTDPDEQPDPAAWHTEIVQPFRG